MAKNSVADWDTTAANNTDIGGVSLAEGVMAMSSVNDAFRLMMAQIAGAGFITSVAIDAATVTTALGYTPLNKAGDTMTGALLLSANTQTNALVRARVGGNAFEFGHANAAGYASVLGAGANGGNPFLAFNAEAGTNPDTYKTRGVKGTVVRGDLAGGLGFYSVATASADNQSLTSLASLDSSGNFSSIGQLKEGANRVYSAANPPPAVASGQPIPTSGSFAPGTLILCASSGAVADGATVAGTTLTVRAAAGAGTTMGIAQSGLWKNVTGATVAAGAIGYFVRLS